MSLSAAEVLTQVNLRTGRAESDIDTQLKGILHDLSLRGLCLEAEETLTLTTDDCDYEFSAFTNKFKKIKTVVIVDSAGVPSKPLTKITWDQYKERLAGNLSAGEPGEFCIFPERVNEVLYLSPKPNATNYPYAKISGPLKHDDSTTISYDEKYRELLIEGCCYKVEAKYNIDSQKTKEHFALYENEISKMFGDSSTIRQSQYSDI